MNCLSFDSPLGPLTVREREGAIVALDWEVTEPRGRSTVLDAAHRQLDEYFARRRREFDLPLRADGSPFELAVWHRMLMIPYGATETYGDLAARIGSVPRAVGTACGRNPLPILIPCHRVVGGRGALTGYSGAGGLGTKRFLLDLETGEPQLDLH